MAAGEARLANSLALPRGRKQKGAKESELLVVSHKAEFPSGTHNFNILEVSGLGGGLGTETRRERLKETAGSEATKATGGSVSSGWTAQGGEAAGASPARGKSPGKGTPH